MILVDTNVLVYASSDGPLSSTATDLLGLGHDLGLRATPRVIEEFAHVHARSHGRESAITITLAWAEGLGPIVDFAEEDLSDAFDMWRDIASLDIADAILAATALRLDARLVSADKAFAAVPDLQFLDLADPDLVERLSPN